MAGGREYSAHQKKIIDRYYRNLDAITLSKLAELVSDLAVTEDARKAARLWDRVAKALGKSDAGDSRIQKILETQDVKALAGLVGELSARS